ncbi:hypothetical protein EXE59_05590 [Nocardioides eburneiflavus]|uniref:Uncharacterized protein n=1 Tax=Nocardioides eburneiflavus TaxID=2518372 RepID=A0A4Z1CJH5_9ACTN|nr:hypothetical protein [Nocardioides eburneiflavus]TGN63480.1 hypothetical protein EXE59_05590 [Nocardioides eburneiflavus]
MHTDDTGVTGLLRRASDDLTPDVHRLVTGGIARGRSRQRRVRIGSAVASLAVIGVAGTLAAVVPGLDDPNSARDTDVAGGGTVATQVPDPDRPPTAAELRPLVPPQEMADAIKSMIGADDVRAVDVDQPGQDRARLYRATVLQTEVSFRIRWYNSPLVTEDGGQPLAPSHICEPSPGVDCSTLPDGSRLLRNDVEPFVSGALIAPAERSLTLATADGWQIDVVSPNTGRDKGRDITWNEPALTMAEIEALVTSDEWFR